MGRHDSRAQTPEVLEPDVAAPRRGLVARALLVVALVVSTLLVITLGFLYVRNLSDEPTATAADRCEPQSLRIIADPTIAAALTAISAAATGAQADGDAACLEVEVVATASSEAAAAFAAGDSDDADLWVPDSSMWVERASQPAAVTEESETPAPAPIALTAGDLIASTPVVLAAPGAVAAGLDPATLGWASIPARAIGAILPDPALFAASDAGLLAIQTTVPGGDPRLFTATVLGLARAVVPDLDTAFATAAKVASSTPSAVVTTEQAVIAHNEIAEDAVVPLYPGDLATAIGYPLVRVGGSAASADAVEAFRAAVLDSADILGSYGLRDATGTVAPEFDGVDAIAQLQLVDGEAQSEAGRTWAVLTAPSRMLSVNDVSGSMDELVGPGQRRIDLFEAAAVGAVKSMSSNSYLSTWIFSTRRIGAQDWQELIPFGPLSDPAFVQQTVDTINGLDSQVGGGTGLYDTVLAAVTHMHDTYDPTMVNAVLLNTDGRDEDDDGIELEQLLEQLRAMNDPARPVPVIAVGYGPDTDQAALQQIADATDGAAYQALQPSDIGTVLIDAITQRGCRPNCG